MELTLSDGKVITLNDQQIQGLDIFSQWYQSGDPFIRIKGYAGTGKTTLSKHFLTTLRKNSSGVSVVVSAPTHKAKAVIARAVGMEGKTIQALCGLGLDVNIENFDPNKPEFVPKKDPEIPLFKFVLIDEASMLNQALLDMVLDIAEDCGTKVIFLFDPAQLPPVNEKICPIEMSDRVTWEVSLTQVERQKEDNPLMPVYDRMRDNLSSRATQYPQQTVLNEKGEGIIINQDNNQFAREMIKAFKEEQEPGMTKVLCWRNVSVAAWNEFIRRYLHGPNCGVLIQNEILMAYTNVRGKIVNSAEYQVQSIEEVVTNYNQSYDSYGKTLHIKTGDIRIFRLKLWDIYEKYTLNVEVIDPRDVNTMAAETKRFQSACFKDRGLWMKYFDWRARFYVLNDVSIAGKKVLKKDLDYGYAITVHKSQGSTYNHVLIDAMDISRNPDTVERNKMHYVAASRPRLTANVLV